MSGSPLTGSEQISRALISKMLVNNSAAHYQFLKGIDPYSCGVVAEPGFEMVHVTLAAPLPWRSGFHFIEEYVLSAHLSRTALCAVELRSPTPFSMEGFIDFNRSYRSVLEEWGLLVDGMNPIARTNVAPFTGAPESVSLYGFSLVRPNPKTQRRAFIVAGAGEVREGILESHRIVRRGEVSPEAILEKADYVLSVMEERLGGLGVSWTDVTCSDIYTIHPLDGPMRDLLLKRLGVAAHRGLCWHVTRPPIVEIEFEMDVRGVACEINL